MTDLNLLNYTSIVCENEWHENCFKQNLFSIKKKLQLYLCCVISMQRVSARVIQVISDK